MELRPSRDFLNTTDSRRELLAPGCWPSTLSHCQPHFLPMAPVLPGLQNASSPPPPRPSTPLFSPAAFSIPFLRYISFVCLCITQSNPYQLVNSRFNSASSPQFPQTTGGSTSFEEKGPVFFISSSKKLLLPITLTEQKTLCINSVHQIANLFQPVMHTYIHDFQCTFVSTGPRQTHICMHVYTTSSIHKDRKIQSNHHSLQFIPFDCL